MLFTKKPLAILLAIVAVVHAAPVAVEARQDVGTTSKSFDAVNHNRVETNAQGFHYRREVQTQDDLWDFLGSLNTELFPILVYGEQEPERRGEWVKAVLDYMAATWPSKNIIIFKRYIGFTVESPNYAGDYQETTYTYVDDKSGISTDFGMVTSSGQGTLRRNGADGGWQNWGYYGTFSTEDGGTRIEFY
ncbi:uncharacterized protein LOC62_02G003481 [Vanrija pseudolonga]|uniref:Uncharacterized protein n=1 Tax=Vanrija pseudolonga TaxID=143232 RepID=A0AAF1BJK6_9TREE|nr:hypothetical protein LOC62_02G003481 [Vanrija pseudolonga]